MEDEDFFGSELPKELVDYEFLENVFSRNSLFLAYFQDNDLIDYEILKKCVQKNFYSIHIIINNKHLRKFIDNYLLILAVRQTRYIYNWLPKKYITSDFIIDMLKEDISSVFYIEERHLSNKVIDFIGGESIYRALINELSF